jgi:hypothetical protein
MAEIIETGWQAMRRAAIKGGKGGNAAEIDRMRHVFFAGAIHVFRIIMDALESEIEGRDDDGLCIEQIEQELNLHIAQLERQHGLLGQIQ